MKKYFKFAIVALTILTMTSIVSCQKDEKDNGTNENGGASSYNPEMKISRIYKNNDDSKFLDQVWTWDGNLLTKIDQYNYRTSHIETTETCTYGNGQLTRITIQKNGGNKNPESVDEFSYDDGKLKQVDRYEEGNLIWTYRLSYNGGKIQTIKVMEYGHDLEFDIDFTWDGDNVKKYYIHDEGNEYVCTFEFTYDDKKNPFYGWLGNFAAEEPKDICKVYHADFYSNFSKNNPTSLNIRISQGNPTVTWATFNYTYNEKGFPITYSFETEDGSNRSYEYEYAE